MPRCDRTCIAIMHSCVLSTRIFKLEYKLYTVGSRFTESWDAIMVVSPFYPRNFSFRKPANSANYVLFPTRYAALLTVIPKYFYCNSKLLALVAIQFRITIISEQKNALQIEVSENLCSSSAIIISLEYHHHFGSF